MLIVCPHCTMSYLVEAPALGSAGRTVRCARCKNQWFAAPPDATAAAQPAYAGEVMADAGRQSVADAAGSQVSRPPESSPETTLPDAPPLSASQEEDLARIRAALEEVASPPPTDDGALAASPPGESEPAPETGTGSTDQTTDSPTDMPTAVVEAPPLVPPIEPEPHGAAAADEENIQHFTARQARHRAARRQRERNMQIPALIAALVMVVGATIMWRNDLVRHVPQTASLFSAIGLPVNIRGLVFDQVTVSREKSDDISVLVIEGHVVSISSKPVEVPRLRFAIRNTAGNEIYSWTARPQRSTLDPGETMPFRSRLASPPAEGNDVVVRFLNQHDLATGMK